MLHSSCIPRGCPACCHHTRTSQDSPCEPRHSSAQPCVPGAAACMPVARLGPGTRCWLTQQCKQRHGPCIPYTKHAEAGTWAPEREHAEGVPACHAEAIDDQGLGRVALRQDQGAGLAEPGASIVGILQLGHPCMRPLEGRFAAMQVHSSSPRLMVVGQVLGSAVFVVHSSTWPLQLIMIRLIGLAAGIMPAASLHL